MGASYPILPMQGFLHLPFEAAGTSYCGRARWTPGLIDSGDPYVPVLSLCSPDALDCLRRHRSLGWLVNCTVSLCKAGSPLPMDQQGCLALGIMQAGSIQHLSRPSCQLSSFHQGPLWCHGVVSYPRACIPKPVTPALLYAEGTAEGIQLPQLQPLRVLDSVSVEGQGGERLLQPCLTAYPFV